MYTDVCTCEVSLTDPKAVTEWNGVILGVLSHGQSAPVHLGKLIEIAPDYAMAHAVKGLAALMLGRRELVEVAAQANNTAQDSLKSGGATHRERLWCAALDAWLRGHPSVAIARMEDALRLNSADTISMKMSHGIRFIIGDSHGMRRSVERVLPAHGEDHPLRGYALGCLAFGMEETGSYAEAERIGLLGLQSAADDAWGLHAVTHVYDMTHRTQDGISLIDNNVSAWDHCNNFRFHVWWHKALLHLDQGDVGKVLALYDSQIRNEKTDDYRDFSNASSLLTRLELENVDVGNRWNELADLAEARSSDGCLVFADLHYMLALASDKREDAAIQMIARVAQNAEGHDEMALIMDNPGVGATEGLAAFGSAQYGTAFEKMRAVQPQFRLMGGSHAQRDVFERITIEAGLRAGRLDATEKLLQSRTSMRDGAVDAFAETRMRMIAEARAVQASFAAE